MSKSELPEDDTDRTLDITTPSGPQSSPLPTQIGRYRILRTLGGGGFGIVYLAYDEQLEREVAMKVAHPSLANSWAEKGLFINEARLVANLDHPNIVPVYDVGSSDDYPCYIVSKLIRGESLAQKRKRVRMDSKGVAELVATVASALHYAHKQGVVHRDVKPSNIMIDESGVPFLVDFGLALAESRSFPAIASAGTPAYMSPEQARGEGHRVHGASDIFSLGVVLYELLTGRQPFRADSHSELLSRITDYDPAPIRQFNEQIPKELDRICSKAMCKRAIDRYQTAFDLADDLRQFYGQPDASSTTELEEYNSPQSRTPVSSESTGNSNPGPVSDSVPLLNVVPKGLRSFDAYDADFFLELLPGPRDRTGIPDSIRFWKTRIEETDPEEAFSVGLIFGPSGSGKTSLVRAGIIPLLSQSIHVVYVEATAEDTERRLLARLHTAGECIDGNLTELLAQKRLEFKNSDGEKLLIVIDQFEQWLNAYSDYGPTELARALRQCDGAHVQCMLMVRDEYWMGVSRFLLELEVALVQGRNVAAVDLFPRSHARKVLTTFGRASGDLPADPRQDSKEQRQFVDNAIDSLVQDEKVVCVRLALFADMMRGRPWTPAELSKVGGASGLGQTFLQETFSARSANPRHRMHQQAARNVLGYLLPENKHDLKGAMRPREELARAAGYPERSKSFEDLLQLLDGELHLITPTDPDGDESWSSIDAANSSEAGQYRQRYYQLTHDYLVRSVRGWLTYSQKQSRRGRATLLLQDRCKEWQRAQSARALPSSMEWVRILTLTDRRSWTSDQRAMMHRATKRSLTQSVAVTFVALALFAVGLAGWSYLAARERSQWIQGMLTTLSKAQLSEVPSLANSLSEAGSDVARPLEQAWRDSEQASPAHQKLTLALVQLTDEHVPEGMTLLLEATPSEVPFVCDALAKHFPLVREQLWRIVESNDFSKPGTLQAASLLARYQPDDPRWKQLAPQLVESVISESPLRAAAWSENLAELGPELTPAISQVCRNLQGNYQPSQVALATDLLIRYASGDQQLLTNVMLDSESEQFRELFNMLSDSYGLDANSFRDELQSRSSSKGGADVPPVSASLRSDFQLAQGMIRDKFAFCQSMSLDKLQRLLPILRQAGYRLTRCRPFTAGTQPRAAAVWLLEDSDWICEFGFTAEQIHQRDTDLRVSGYEASDVAGYTVLKNGGFRDQYSAVWTKAAEGRGESRIFVGELDRDLPQLQRQLRTDGFSAMQTMQFFRAADGNPRYSGIATENLGGDQALRNQHQLEFAQLMKPGVLRWDVDIARTEQPLSTRERYERQLQIATEQLEEAPDRSDAIFRRAQALFHLHRDQEAEEAFNSMIGMDPSDVVNYMYQAVTQARLGKSKDAFASINKIKELEASDAWIPYHETVVDIYLGKDREALRKLSDFAESAVEKKDAWLDLSKAYGIAAGLSSLDESHKGEYAVACVEALRRSIDYGYRDFFWLQRDEDLESVRGRPEYENLMRKILGDVRFSSVRRVSEDVDVTLLPVAPSSQILEDAARLAALGYRPLVHSAIQLGSDLPQGSSLASDDSGQSLGIGLWYRPKSTPQETQRLLRRRANAGVALLRLGEQAAWNLLGNRRDPDLATYMLHRARPCGLPLPAVVEQLESQVDENVRQALILLIGEYDPQPDETQLADRMADIYLTSPSPGVHSAAEWVLRTWGMSELLAATRNRLVEQQPKPEQHWRIDENDLTFIRMELPALPGHKVHQFEITAHEVTRRQMEAFLRQLAPIDDTSLRAAPDIDCPQIKITWYDAARYCRWLSERADLPTDQMCYPKIADIRSDMQMASDFLEQTGFRLPTEAEWEFACRGTSISRYFFGDDYLHVGYYAWSQENARMHTHPVGLLKPNPYGLFDVYGNAWEWCHDREQTPWINAALGVQNETVTNRDFRILRGGSYYLPGDYLESSQRAANLPSFLGEDYGFRIVRTVVPTADEER